MRQHQSVHINIALEDITKRSAFPGKIQLGGVIDTAANLDDYGDTGQADGTLGLVKYIVIWRIQLWVVDVCYAHRDRISQKR